MGICQWSLPIDGPYCCKICSELGLEGIQLEFSNNKKGFPLSKKITQQAYLETAEMFGIIYPSLAVRETDSFGLTHANNSEDRKIVVTAVTKAIETAEAMKIHLVMIPSFKKSNIETENDFHRLVSLLRYACDYAKDKGVTIGTENLLSVDDTFRLFEEVNRPNLKLYFDSQNHYLYKGYCIPEMLEKLMLLLCDEIHLKDGKDGYLSGALLGKGDTNFYSTMEVLKKQNYSGWLILENYYDQEPLSLLNKDPIELIKKDIQILKLAIN
jgi:sugar phosphate isomerase/epimerase